VLTPELLREAPILTQLAFTRLLEWLDDGVESHGDRYLEMRRRLVSYFDRRNRPNANQLADETLNRIRRTLEQTGVIATKPPACYCYVIARFVLLEDLRRGRRHVPFDEPRSIEASRSRGTSVDESSERLMLREDSLDCLDRSLGQLKPEQRDLVIEYYRDAHRQRIDRRRDLARRLGITTNALAIRACRIRDALFTVWSAKSPSPTEFWLNSECDEP
jgi:DNA-directed RNA polymerase specialized sigma24 family protein